MGIAEAFLLNILLYTCEVTKKNCTIVWTGENFEMINCMDCWASLMIYREKVFFFAFSLALNEFKA